MKHTFLFLLLLGILSGGTATAKGNETKKKLAQADAAFVLDNYDKALPLYLDVIAADPANDNVRFKIGMCYLNSSVEKTKAESFLETASKNTTPKYRETSLKEKRAPLQTWYLLGQAYHFNYKFDQAILAFETFRAFLGEADSIMVRDLNHYIQVCNNGKELTASPVNIKVEHLGSGINSPYSDHSPVISADESVMVFTSRRPNTTGGKTDPNDGKYFEDVYISYRNGDSWSAAQSIGSSINSNGHEASIGLSVDGQELYIYKDDAGDGNIYVSKLNGKEWSVPRKLTDFVNSKKHEASASISPDGNTLYFSSEREGGLGGHDIYRSVKLPNGEWSKPTNLGPTINTPYDDDAPSLQADGVTLYFSSKGHNTIGGYDIFFSTFVEEFGWTKPINVGYPVNTTDDDTYYVPTADNKHAYYSSFKNEGGMGEKDIYRLTFPDRSETPLTVFTGEITSIYGGVPEDAFITVTDVETGEVIGTYKPNTETGKYVIVLQSGRNYSLTYEAANYLYQSDNMNVADTTAYMVINRPVQLEPLKVGQKLTVRNIFFASGKSELQPESKKELDKLTQLMKQFPGLIVEISGHTDASGSDELNQRLSQKRAEAVAAYLVQNGIENKRLRTIGFGESKPIAINYNPDGKANKQGMSLNRRFEFTILSVDGQLKDVVEQIKVPDQLKNNGEKDKK